MTLKYDNEYHILASIWLYFVEDSLSHFNVSILTEIWPYYFIMDINFHILMTI
jgi:hypothetical protein